MAEVEGLHHTCFTVSDLERSLAFYRDLLGCEVVARRERRGGFLAEIVGYLEAHVRMAYLRVPPSEHLIELFEYVTPASAPAPIEPRLVGAAHLCFLVADLRGLYERLRAAGVDSFFSPPIEVSDGQDAGGLALYLRDPDGIVVELYQPPRGARGSQVGLSVRSGRKSP